MAIWTSEELDKIGSAEELKIEALLPGGTLAKAVTIWVVRLGDDLYIRSIHGRTGVWFRSTQLQHAGRIRAGGVTQDVDFVDETDPELNAQIDDVYRAKYREYEASIVNTELTPMARASTLKLVPRRES